MTEKAEAVPLEEHNEENEEGLSNSSTEQLTETNLVKYLLQQFHLDKKNTRGKTPNKPSPNLLLCILMEVLQTQTFMCFFKISTTTTFL